MQVIELPLFSHKGAPARSKHLWRNRQPWRDSRRSHGTGVAINIGLR